MTRRIVQISADPDGTDVLCDDGSFWRLGAGVGGDRWTRLPDIPQDGYVDDGIRVVMTNEPGEPDPIAELEEFGARIVGDLDGGAQWACHYRGIWVHEGISLPYAIGIPAAAARLLARVKGESK